MPVPSNQLHTKQHESWINENINSIEAGLLRKVNPDIALDRAINLKNNIIKLSNTYNTTRDNSLAELLMKTSEAIGRLGPASNACHYPRGKDDPVSLSEAFMHLDREIEMGNGMVLTHPIMGVDNSCYAIKEGDDFKSQFPHISQGGLRNTQPTVQRSHETGNWCAISPATHHSDDQHQLKISLINDSKDSGKNENRTTAGNERSNTRRRRPNHPKQVTTALYAWYNMHKDNPYPDDCAKKVLQQQTGLNAVQLNNWFINGRIMLNDFSQ